MHERKQKVETCLSVTVFEILLYSNKSILSVTFKIQKSEEQKNHLKAR